MALTKKDQAAMAAMRDEVLLAKAFRWTPPMPRTVLRPTFGEKDTSGWDFNVHTEQAYEAWSSSISHGKGAKRDPQYGNSQNPRDLFATKRLALMAMRHAMENNFALTLAKVDKQIEEAE